MAMKYLKKCWELCVISELILFHQISSRPLYEARIERNATATSSNRGRSLVLCRLQKLLLVKSETGESHQFHAASKLLQNISQRLGAKERQSLSNFGLRSKRSYSDLYSEPPGMNPGMQPEVQFDTRLRFDPSRIPSIVPPPPTGAPANCVLRATLSNAQQNSLVTAHNNARRSVSPAGANMRVMTWDDELAFLASQRTSACVFEEPDSFMQWDGALPVVDTPRHYGLNVEVGFNWFAWGNTGNLPPDFASDVVAGWLKEKQHFDSDYKTCSSVCRHYLQVVWAQSYKIGCSASCCPVYNINGVIWRSTTLLLCAYAPRGNVIDSRTNPRQSGSYLSPFKTQFPYLYGASCQKCGETSDSIRLNSINDFSARLHIKSWLKTTARDYCDDLLCANYDRDRDIPFVQRRPGTTTFAWSSVSLVTTPPFISTSRNPNLGTSSPNPPGSGCAKTNPYLWNFLTTLLLYNIIV